MLATLTTAVGFLTNVTNDIPALAEFGELAAVGIVCLVPADAHLRTRGQGGPRSAGRTPRSPRQREPREAARAGRCREADRRTACAARHFAVGTLIVALLLTGVAAFSMTNLSTKFSFLDFVPTTSPLRDTAVTVDERFDFPETTSVLVKGDVATGAAWNTMLDSYLAAADGPDGAGRSRRKPGDGSHRSDLHGNDVPVLQSGRRNGRRRALRPRRASSASTPSASSPMAPT